jgi:hypothetical protein
MEIVLHVFNQLMAALNWVAVNVPWAAVVASGILPGLLMGPQRLFKRWFKNHEPWIVGFIAVLGPVIVATWSYILHHYGTDPRMALLQGLALSFSTQPFYFIVWKPWVIGKLWPMFANWIASQVQEAEHLNQEKASVPLQDFKP